MTATRPAAPLPLETFRLVIPRWHPTRLNKLSGHWSRGYKFKKADGQMVWAAVRYTYAYGAERKRRVSITITLKPGQRAADPDAYWKSTCDALVKAGALVNDSHVWVELAPVQYRRGTSKDWGTEIVLEDVL